jgi:hypothetical protein
MIWVTNCAGKEKMHELMQIAEEEEERFHKEVGADENLPNYFKAIPGHEMKAWYTQELYNRKVLGIKNMQNSMMKRLQLTKRTPGGKLLSPGEVNYDILNSQTYALQLNYFGIVDRDLPDEDEPNHYTPHEVGEWRIVDMISKALNIDDHKSKPKHWKGVDDTEGRIM